MNRVKHIEHTFGTNDIRSFDYGYDSVGRRQYMQRDGDKADGFGYGQSEQIYDFRVGGTVNVATGAVTGGILTHYDFDKRGNRTGVTVNGALTNYTTANDLNQYPKVGAQTAGYDWNGNLNTYNGWTYVYDGLNRLTSASAVGTSATYYYDGLNRQVKRVVDGSTVYSVWDGWNLAAEYGPASALLSRYFYGAGGDLVKNDVKGQFYYPDAQGSTSFVATSTGVLQEQYTYDLYGKPAYLDAAKNPLTGSVYGVDMLYTGQKWYSGYGILDLRNRAYFASLGRFLQPDPIGFGGDSGNLYRYCGNNPANLSDPTGMFSLSALWNKIVKVFSNNGTIPGTTTAYGAPRTGTNIPDTQTRTELPGGGYDRVDHNAVTGYTYLGSFTDGGTSIPRATAVGDGGGIGDFIGKIWALPNTVLGLAVQAVLSPFALAHGGGFQLGNNSIQLVGLQFGDGALTLGNTQIYFKSGPGTDEAYGQSGAFYGPHEQGHTYQNQIFGPLFLPAYFLSGHPFSLDNPFEAGAQAYAFDHPPGG